MRAFMVGLLMMTGLAAGCASGPEIRVTTSGASPAATSFGWLDESDPATAAAVGTELQKRGWRILERNAAWQVEVLQTRRNQGAGAFTSEVRPEEEMSWTVQPAPRRWWQRKSDERGLTLALVDNATGERIARGEAWTLRRPDQVSDDRLAAAAVEALLSAGAVPPPEAR